jgi:hypothetical protein
MMYWLFLNISLSCLLLDSMVAILFKRDLSMQVRTLFSWRSVAPPSMMSFAFLVLLFPFVYFGFYSFGCCNTETVMIFLSF